MKVLFGLFACLPLFAQPGNMDTVPAGSTVPPVVLVNGWQGPSCVPASGPSDTFGSLADQLRNVNNVPVVYFFDNCAVDANARIEDLGQDLAQFLSQIVYDDGTPVPQVDIVPYSMGGLITRAYLAGLKSDGTFAPPLNPGIRKFVEVATPNFGSFFLASLPSITAQSIQAAEMIPGSMLLWNLATWNQRGDDLRGVDALAIIGSGGNFGTLQAASDGVVSVSSGSLSYTRDIVRTRILPYCHTDPGAFTDPQLASMKCSGAGIANVDEASETGAIILSFLANTGDWTGIGKTPKQNDNLVQYGGMYFSMTSPAGQFVNDISSVTWGPVPLIAGGASTSVFYQEFVWGTAAFDAISKSFGDITCTAVTVQPGYYNTIRCKGYPSITSLAPKVVGPMGTVIQAGSAITLSGYGFGASQCRTCSITMYPGALPLTPSSWSDNMISVVVPADAAGYTQLALQTASGKDVMNFMAVPPQ